MTEETIVRENLMFWAGYAPYCGNNRCMSRTKFNGEQFACTCGWVSDFPKDFIDRYKAKWNLKPASHD